MTTISRALTRRLRIAFSRGLGITARQPGPAVEFQSNPQELVIRVQNDEVAIEYREPGEHTSQQFAVPFELLRRCEGTKNESVTLETSGETIHANWADAGIPQVAQFEALEFGEIPSLPDQMATNPSQLAEALRDATETADKESTRYALNHLRLRGSDGQIAATDGRQLLVQDGFTFPWDDELLIPANRLLTTSTLAGGEAVEIGRTDDWVTLRSGSWTVWLRIEKTARFPHVDDHLPPITNAATTLHLSDADAEFLTNAVKRLPATDEYNGPLTVDLNGAVSVRAKGPEDQTPTEIVLSGSRRDGEAVRFNTNRDYLARAARMGFRTVHIFGQEAPARCQEQNRAYVWALLGKDGIIAADPTTVRIESGSNETTPTIPKTRRITTNMTTTTSRPAKPQTVRPTQSSESQSTTPLEAAEAVRDSLKETLDRTRDLIAVLRKRKKQSRLVENTLASLRQLHDVA